MKMTLTTAPRTTRCRRVVTRRIGPRSAHAWRDRGTCYVVLMRAGAADRMYRTRDTGEALRAVTRYVDDGVVPGAVAT